MQHFGLYTYAALAMFLANDLNAQGPAPATGAFTASYYDNVNLNGNPILTTTTSQIDFDWGMTPDRSLPDGFSVRWQGTFHFDAGMYFFTVTTSDGMRIYIDGYPILDRWRDQPPSSYALRPNLTQGQHVITVEHYQQTRFGVAHLSWNPAVVRGPAPIIQSFTASRSTISPGDTIALSWTVSGANTLSLDNGVGDVSRFNAQVIAPRGTTTYTLTAANDNGTTSAQVIVTVRVTAPPSAGPPPCPTLLSAVAKGPTAVDVSWRAAAAEIAIQGFQVLRSGLAIASITAPNVTYTDNTVAPNATYTYAVRAYDAAGNFSTVSNSASVVTPPAGTVCPDPATGVFTACYYPNTSLTGSPVLVGAEAAIDHDWSNTPPPAALSGGFSVRWQGKFAFEAGTYRVTATTSDGMRMYIDGSLIVDRWRDQPAYTYTAQPTLTQGIHVVTVEYYQQTGNGIARVSWQPVLPPAPVVASFTATPLSVTPGQPVNLAWSVSGAIAVTIDNGVGDVSRVTAQTVYPVQTTTYKLTAANASVTTAASVTVTVTAPATVRLPAPSLTSVVAKSAAQVDLAWSATASAAVQGFQILRNGAIAASVSAATSVYSDTGVAANMTYLYTVRTFDSAGNNSPSSNGVSVTTPAGQSSNTIAACRDISQSGRYVLAGDLTAPRNASCLTIHDTQDVQLDCQQHSVTIDRNNDPGNDSALSVSNVKNYSIANCTIKALNTTISKSMATVAVNNSPQGTFTNNTFSGGYISMTNSDGLRLAYNNSTAPVGVSGNNETIENNTINLDPGSRYATVLGLGNSSGSLIQNNVLNGGWDGLAHQTLDVELGADDGIVPYNVSNSVIRNNTILNVWDCGIESTKALVNVQILDNKITTAGICGVGGWYGNSLKNVVVSGNIVTDAPRLFDYWRADPLYASDGEQSLVFVGNTLTNNKLLRPRLTFMAPGSGRLDFQNLPAAIPAGALVAGGNRIRDNDFGPLGTSLDFAPAASIADGGGNICEPESSPVVRCTPPQPANYFAITAMPASPGVVAPGGVITVMYGANPAAEGDYVGLARVDAGDQSFVSTKPASGARLGLMIFTAPSTPGRYELRYMQAGATSHAAVSNPVIVSVTGQ